MATKPSVHIYPLSRLVHASPSVWLSQLRAIEENKLFANRYYSPLRDGVVSYCRNGGRRRDHILSHIRAQASLVTAPRGNPERDNVAAFQVFVDAFYPKLQGFGKSYLHEDSTGWPFQGVDLLGAPHFTATDSNGRGRYVYLHASKWDDDDLKAYLELLSIIIEGKFHSAPETLWCMDLRNGRDLRWHSSSRVRSKCANATNLYARLVKTLSSP